MAQDINKTPLVTGREMVIAETQGKASQNCGVNFRSDSEHYVVTLAYTA